MSAPFYVSEVKVVRHGWLWLRFADDTAGELDVTDALRGPVFEEARTELGFQRVTIDAEGHTVCWPGGADLAPDVLHRAVHARTDLATAREDLTREMQARLDEVAAGGDQLAALRSPPRR